MKLNKLFSIILACGVIVSSAFNTSGYSSFNVYAETENTTDTSTSEPDNTEQPEDENKYKLMVDNCKNIYNTVTEFEIYEGALKLLLNSEKGYHISEIIIDGVSLPKEEVYEADDIGLIYIPLNEEKETKIEIIFSENNDCEITFLNYEGEKVKSMIIPYGEAIDYSAVDTSDTSSFYKVIDAYTQIRFYDWDCNLENARDDMKINALYQKASMAIKSLPTKTKYSFKSEDIDLTGLSVILTVDTQLPEFDEKGNRKIKTEELDVAEICYANFKTAGEAFKGKDESEIIIYAPKNEKPLASYKATFSTPFILGDVDENGSVDSSDASNVLAYYAAIATANTSVVMTDVQKSKADVDKNKLINAADASYVLSYYALTSVGAEPTWDDVINTKK